MNREIDGAYLANPGATVHSHYGETLDEEDTLVTFIYQKSRSGGIIQGFPKVEQVSEASLKNSWNERTSRIIVTPLEFLICTEANYKIHEKRNYNRTHCNK